MGDDKPCSFCYFSIFSSCLSSLEGFYYAAVLAVLVALTNFKINMVCMEKAHC